MHNHTRYTFYENPSIAFGVVAEYGKILKWKQLKGNTSITDNILRKVHMHNQFKVIYIQYTFHESPSNAYKVMAEDEINHQKVCYLLNKAAESIG